MTWSAATSTLTCLPTASLMWSAPLRKASASPRNPRPPGAEQAGLRRSAPCLIGVVEAPAAVLRDSIDLPYLDVMRSAKAFSLTGTQLAWPDDRSSLHLPVWHPSARGRAETGRS